jgi:hypothetical protein
VDQNTEVLCQFSQSLHFAASRLKAVFSRLIGLLRLDAENNTCNKVLFFDLQICHFDYRRCVSFKLRKLSKSLLGCCLLLLQMQSAREVSESQTWRSQQMHGWCLKNNAADH